MTNGRGLAPAGPRLSIALRSLHSFNGCLNSVRLSLAALVTTPLLGYMY